jgi:hypothetical protein
MTPTSRTVKPAVHAYTDDGTRDHNDAGRCTSCGTPERNGRHDPAVLAARAERLHQQQAAVAGRYNPEED